MHTSSTNQLSYKQGMAGQENKTIEICGNKKSSMLQTWVQVEVTLLSVIKLSKLGTK
jgi:hypothetical protein